MAILTDDCDINDAVMYMLHGGNGDYYICLKQTESNGGLDYQSLGVRFAMSGGCISKYPKVAKAIWELYRAMEEAGLNNPDTKD